MTYSSTILATTGLVHYYRLDDTNGAANSTILDSVTSGAVNGLTQNSGCTANVAGLLTGDTDKCFAFASSGDGCVKLNSNLTPLGTSSYSWEVWVKPTNQSGSNQRIIGNDVYTTQNKGPSLLWDGPSNRVISWRATDSNSVSCSVGASSANKIFHIVVTYDGAALRLYINGACNNAQNDTTSIPSNSNQFIIGANGGWGNSWDGDIDEVAIYNVALSGETIRNHYNVGKNQTITANTNVWYGAFINTGVSWDYNPPANYGEIDTWTNWATNNGASAHKPAIFHKYQNWANDTAMDTGAAKAAAARNADFLLSWEPWNPANGADQPTYSLQNIVNGNFDTYIANFALSIKAYGSPIFLRFAHEFNGDWYPWGTDQTNQGDYTTKNTPALYVSAWQHVWNIFNTNGVTNVKWVWCPNAWHDQSSTGAVTSASYPGDSYVDYVGIDFYNFGQSSSAPSWTYSGGMWQYPIDLISLPYDTIQGITSKKMIICEVATSDNDNGGSKGSWISSFMSTDLPTYFPNIIGFVWFDYQQPLANNGRPWSIDSGAGALSAFQTAIATSIYNTAPPLAVQHSAVSALNALARYTFTDIAALNALATKAGVQTTALSALTKLTATDLVALRGLVNITKSDLAAVTGLTKLTSTELAALQALIQASGVQKLAALQSLIKGTFSDVASQVVLTKATQTLLASVQANTQLAGGSLIWRIRLMNYKIQRGSTNRILRVFIQNAASMSGLTGLAYNSSGLICRYAREGDPSSTSVPLVSAGIGLWVSGGFAQIDSVNMPGWYELGVPNAALSSGDSVAINLSGAANMAPGLISIELDAVNYQDSIAFGLSRLLNLSNQGQTVALGSGSGGLVYSGTITNAGIPAIGVVVRCYGAQDVTSGADINAVTDVSTLIAQATTGSFGEFELSLVPGYYALQYFINGQPLQNYLRWSTRISGWISSNSPISVSQL